MRGYRASGAASRGCRLPRDRPACPDRRAWAGPRRRVPVIAMSASRGHLAAAQTVGADAILPKPFDLDKLVDLVEAYCDEARRQMSDSRT